MPIFYEERVYKRPKTLTSDAWPQSPPKTYSINSLSFAESTVSSGKTREKSLTKREHTILQLCIWTPRMKTISATPRSEHSWTPIQGFVGWTGASVGLLLQISHQQHWVCAAAWASTSDRLEAPNHPSCSTNTQRMRFKSHRQLQNHTFYLLLLS